MFFSLFSQFLKGRREIVIIMKRNLAYLLVVVGLILIVSNSTVAEAEYYSINMDLEITDSYYTNIEDDKNKPDDDIIIDFEVNLEFYQYFYEDDNNNFIGTYTLFQVKFKVQLILPSGFVYEYSFLLYISVGNSEFRIYLYNHATESGWYIVKIWGVLRYTHISVYDEMIFDPPGQTGDTDPPEIEFITL